MKKLSLRMKKASKHKLVYLEEKNYTFYFSLWRIKDTCFEGQWSNSLRLSQCLCPWLTSFSLNCEYSHFNVHLSFSVHAEFKQIIFDLEKYFW